MSADERGWVRQQSYVRRVVDRNMHRRKIVPGKFTSTVHEYFKHRAVILH